MERICQSGVTDVILRVKELSEAEYENLACQVIPICKKYHVNCILHHFDNVANKLNHKMLHMPLSELINVSNRENYEILGASCHSVEDAILAEKMGCTYVTLSHIFATDCKRDLEPKGVALIRNAAEKIKIPIYALGGINPDNARACIDAGAAGICSMGEYMRCDDIRDYTEKLNNAVKEVIVYKDKKGDN